MLKLLKYMKRSIIPIIAIVLLLFVQAFCDLKLPDYTSTIVNNGIQQGGIVDCVPAAVRESTLTQMQILLNDEEKKVVKDHYTLVSKDTMNQDDYEDYIKQYPEASKQPVYVYNNEADDKAYQQLDDIFGKSFMVLNLAGKDASQTEMVRQQILAGLPPQVQQMASQLSLKEMLSYMPADTIAQMNQTISDKLAQVPDTMIIQSVAPMIRNEYQMLGVDVDSMQIWYIVSEGLKMVLVALLSLASVVLVTLLAARVAASLGHELRKRTFGQVLEFSNRELDQFSTASLITRTSNDIQQVQLLLPILLRIVFYAPIIAIGGIIKVASSQSSMLWVVALAVGVILCIVVFMFLAVLPKMERMQKLIDRVNQVMRETLTGLWVIRAFSTQKHEEKRFDDANMDLTKTNLFVNRVMACMMPAMMFIMNSIAILVVWVGAHGVDEGTMQVGNMMAVIQYTMQIIMAFLMISMISVMLPRASVAARRIEEVLTTEPTILDPKQPKPFREDKKGYVEFRNVSFRYPSADENVLHNIDFVAKPGETTAFIGSTGSGKSTLLNLIPRFYDATEGEVLVDGVNVKDVTQHDLRKRLGYVPQKGVLFSGTIESNIKYGKEEIPDAQMEQAAQIAQAEEFIATTPNHYDAPIAQGGGNVSGGQKQRLSIARAIAGNPEVYMFDDSFSALDFKTDVKLRSALHSQTQGSTVLIVAQRISTIMNAEQILVLDHGKIVGQGTHKELLKNCEVYREIATSQLSEEELANE